RDNPGGYWQVAIKPLVEIRFTDPSIVDLGFRAGRNSLWVGHIHHRHNSEFFYRPKITAPRLGLQLSMPHFSRMASSSTATVAPVEQIVNAKEPRTPKIQLPSRPA